MTNNLDNLLSIKGEKGSRVCRFWDFTVDDETFVLITNTNDSIINKLRSPKTTLEQVQDILEQLITRSILQDKDTSTEQKGKLLFDNK